MSKTRVEIWMGGLEMPAYTIRDVERVDLCGYGATVRVVDIKGYIFETSPNNILMITEPEEKK